LPPPRSVTVVERARAARVLGVDITATPDQVRDAYRRRAREVHPDRFGGDTAAMIELNAAHEALSVRAGDGWEFAGSSTSDGSWTPRPASDEPFDDGSADELLDPPSAGGWPLLRVFPIVLGIVGAVTIVIVFVAAIGYDWSLSP